jgi:hypothetical protein
MRNFKHEKEKKKLKAFERKETDAGREMLEVSDEEMKKHSHSFVCRISFIGYSQEQTTEQ